jgi:geranylgeranyl pyrophosphate synthase
MPIVRELDLVEKTLKDAVGSDIDVLAQIGAYVFEAGGKRLRPKVVLLSYKAVGGMDAVQAVPLAAVVELLHTASLIHDDINDSSALRRGQETINTRWGNNLAILAGDFIFIQILSLMASFEPSVIKLLAECCSAAVEGETLQMINRGNTEMSEELYLEIVSKKTACIFSACAKTGGILAAGTERDVATLGEYGFNLGMAFQIRDDALDLVGDIQFLGKPTFTDIGQGTMNLVTLFAIRKLEEAREVLLSEKRNAAQAKQLLRDTGALDYAVQRAEMYAHKAKKALSSLPESDAKTSLHELADFAVARNQ